MDCTAIQRIARLRRDLSPQRAHLVLQQVELRAKAHAKFAAAERMFLTPLGLEQASDEVVARYKAERFPNGGQMADLCCGIGGDLLALAARGPVCGVDRDPILAIVAEANARVGVADGDRPIGECIHVQTTDVRSLDVTPFAAWHIDPDRRSEGRRTTRVDLHEPPPDVIERLLAACPNGAVKLAPAAVLPTGWAERAELEWISSRRECRQLVAWFGNLANSPGRRRATVLGAAREQRRTVCGEGESPIGPICPLGPTIDRFVFEPDAAVIAAHLTGALAAEHGLRAIAPRAVYLTGPRAIDDLALSCFEVLEVLPLRAATLKRWLADRRIGRLEIKKRGIELDPRQLQRQLKLPGDEQATLLATRLGQRAIAIIARRIV